MRRAVIMGAGGRDFHVFATMFRDNPDTRVVAFTAAQIPGIDDRTYPATLAGPAYPDGIPILAEPALPALIAEHDVDEVVLAYSDLSHLDVMHKASMVLAAGADFRLAGPDATMLRSSKPVVGIGAVRTGCGKSQTTRAVGRLLLDAGLRVALIRHPMPYGDLAAMRVQRFATLDDIDASDPTVEEREEYETPVALGMVMFAGVDYEAILRAAEAEADVIVWDGGNNDFPFVRPDLMITVVDPHRAGHEERYHPGEATLRMADVVVVNKLDSAAPADIDAVGATVARLAPSAAVVRAESPVTLDGDGSLAGQRVL
ncbi:MAG: GTP-binding protein, partial [Jiangellales bacterium]